jgi:2-succinyl-6-hydroxy-2,4-cyclohexadiene-1-carboxylate synthase
VIALLHGFLGDPSVWDGIVDGEAFALPGHLGGGPVHGSWSANLDAIAARVRGCDVVIGYSLGARVALGLLAIGAVPRVIAISVNPGIDENAREIVDGRDGPAEIDASVMRLARKASDRAWANRFRTEPLAEVLDAWEAQPLFATQSRVAPDTLGARRARRLQLDPAELARSLEHMGLAEMPDYRSLIDDRCTLVVGADDAKYVAIARGVSAPVHVIDQCGHDPLLEQPAALAKVLASLS